VTAVSYGVQRPPPAARARQSDGFFSH